MDQGSAAGSAASSTLGMGPITTVHLILIALFAIAAVFVILRGIANRRRIAASREQAGLDLKTGAALEDPEQSQPATDDEDIAAAPFDTAPASLAADPAPDRDERAPLSGDDLTRIKGLGPKLAAQLNGLGVTRFADIAGLTPEAAAALDAQLGSFTGRLDRDRWIEQARFLAAGDKPGYEAVFGRLG